MKSNPEKEASKGMAKIVAVVQTKGGSGKSTVATNLAGELGRKRPVLLIDADPPQSTAASWYSLRQQAERADHLSLQSVATARELGKVIEASTGEQAYIVIDGAARAVESVRASLLLADLVLLPVAASLPEIWAMGDLLAVIEEARNIRPVEVRLVWTRHRPTTILARDLPAQAAEELGLPALKTALGMRVAYIDAMGQGLTVAELPDPAARAELIGLMAEVIRLLR